MAANRGVRIMAERLRWRRSTGERFGAERSPAIPECETENSA
jgi:hypothetical protein